MRALVTGATGFVGQRLLERLERPVVLTRNVDRARRELAWPWLVAQSLETAGSAWALTHTRYYATAPGALGYLERQLGASAPDVVILSVTLYAYSMRTVANRIRHVAGKRAGDWAEARFR